MRNVATNGGKETLERNSGKEREIVFQQSFDCLLNDRKCAVYCHLRMKLAWCMLDKSWRGIGRGTNKTTSAQILGTTEGGFCLSRKWLWHWEGEEGIIQLGQQGFKELLPDSEKNGAKNYYMSRMIFSQSVKCFKWKMKGEKKVQVLLREKLLNVKWSKARYIILSFMSLTIGFDLEIHLCRTISWRR